MFNNLFNSPKYIKVLESDWEWLKKVISDDKATIEALKLVQSPVLQRQIQDLNDEIEQLRKYKRNDALIYAWEEHNKESKMRIKHLENENEHLKETLHKTKHQLEKEQAMVSLFAKNYQENNMCKQMRTASAFELYM